MEAQFGERVDITDRHEDPFQSLNSARKVLRQSNKIDWLFRKITLSTIC